MKSAYSVHKVRIRLTDERWLHISENHDDLASKKKDVLLTIGKPDFVALGIRNEYLAVRKFGKNWMIVIYQELDKKDGFVITAFKTSRIAYVVKKEIIWKKES